jgi:putative ABC transport system permease protein
MRLAGIVRLKLRSLFQGKRADQELDEELQYHLERQTEEEIAAGAAPAEARCKALRVIGNVGQRREECRDARGTRWLEDFARDLQYAFQQFLRNKNFFAIAAVTLALGIGATTAIFSTVSAVLLRPFPYRDAERLTSVWCTVPSKGIPKMGCALPDLQEIAARNRSFESLASYYSDDINVTDGTPERVSGVRASAGLFSVLGVTPAIGRTCSRSEETFGRNHVVVLSDALWHERFAGMPGVIGKVVHLNGEPYTVIGVMPPDFEFPNRRTRVWMPMSFAPSDDMATRDNHFIDSIARLRPDVTFKQSKADLAGIARQLEREFSQNAGMGIDASDYVSSIVGDVRPVLFILLGAVGVVLLIACVNIANLLLSRASGRERELSVRAALGASRGRLFRQLLSESLLIGGAGACLGIALSFWLVRLIRTFSPENIPRVHASQIDGFVLLFVSAITAGSVLLFGLAPAISLARAGVSDALKEGGRSQTTSARSGRSRNLLVISEIALSLVLVIGAGLLFETLRTLQRVDPGLKPENVLTMSVTLPWARYSQPAKTERFFSELTTRLEQIPGAISAGASTAMPIAGWGGWGKYFTVEEHPATRLADVPFIQYTQVTPHFAKALGIRLIQGRFFSADDVAGRPLVAVINESARKRFFPGVDPVGKRVYPNPPESTITKRLPSPQYRSPRLTIVGVIADVRRSGLSHPVQPELFVPYLQATAKDNQTPSNKMFLFIKTASEPLGFVDAVRQTVLSLDPEQPVADIATMQQRLEASLAPEQFQAALLEAFAIVALALAAVGIYGVLSYSVRLRMHEIGIRIALGADSGEIVKTVVKHALRLGLAGISIGTILGIGAGRLLASFISGVRADSAIFVSAVLILAAVIAAATFMPAARATRADALALLRNE